MEKKILKSINDSGKTPLKIGTVEIPCYVLNNGQRVISQSGMLKALGMATGSAGKEGGDRLAKFAAQDRFNGLITNEVISMITNPMTFKTVCCNCYIVTPFSDKRKLLFCFYCRLYICLC